MSYLLEPVGVARVDNDVYLALLRAERAGPEELAERLSLPVETVCASLATLSFAGLAIQMCGETAMYVAAPPDVAVPLLIQRRRSALARLQVSVDDLAEEVRRTSAAGPEGTVAVVKGADAVIAAITRLQGEARDEILMVDAPPYVGGSPSRNDAELTQLASGVVYRAIYHPDSLASAAAVEHMRECMKNGEQARVHSAAGPKLVVADRREALVVASHDAPDPLHRVLIGPSTLLEIVISHFDSLWDKATPLDDSCTEPGIGPRDRELLRLLASGMKDRSIARTMGVTERTVGRRVTELMERLDADTRFKAGVQAALRNWL